MRWHRAARCPSFISPRRNKVVSRSNIANPFPFPEHDPAIFLLQQIKDTVHASRREQPCQSSEDVGQKESNYPSTVIHPWWNRRRDRIEYEILFFFLSGKWPLLTFGFWKRINLIYSNRWLNNLGASIISNNNFSTR